MTLTGKNIPLNCVTPSTAFRLLGVKAIYRYEGTQRTNEIEGYKYVVGDGANYEQFEVKIMGNTPIITPEQFKTITGPIDVQFQNCVVKQYRRDGEYALSISAESIRVLN